MKVAPTVLIITCISSVARAFSHPNRARAGSHTRQRQRVSLLFSTETDDFASFAATLEEPVASSSSGGGGDDKTWQGDLERLLDPTTPVAQRQILLSDLMSANEEIRASVETALRDRKIDPLLTPTGRKIQDGTRAVARQLTNDILPSLAPNAPGSGGGTTLQQGGMPFSNIIPKPQDFSRIGNRMFNAVSNQMARDIKTLQSDLANPSQIPERISKQSQDLLKEAQNVFAETPAGLAEPQYTVVSSCSDYQIRDYQAYTVATTSMDSSSNPADQGVAFNTLAAYTFGANAEDRAMSMTTPVTTTATGEMRFFVPDSAPDPLSDDATEYEYNGMTAVRNKIRIERIPAARLAVRRFAGFCTAGEIARQKDQLLAALALDASNVELDVPHGQTVGHVVFQYNPPYTLPVLRRNEIAVPVVQLNNERVSVEESWAAASSSSDDADGGGGGENDKTSQ